MTVGAESLIGLVVSAVTLGYLVLALLRPEKF
jgi:K+-transporting ATPase KdpF subunit